MLSAENTTLLRQYNYTDIADYFEVKSICKKKITFTKILESKHRLQAKNGAPDVLNSHFEEGEGDLIVGSLESLLFAKHFWQKNSSFFPKRCFLPKIQNNLTKMHHEIWKFRFIPVACCKQQVWFHLKCFKNQPHIGAWKKFCFSERKMVKLQPNSVICNKMPCGKSKTSANGKHQNNPLQGWVPLCRQKFCHCRRHMALKNCHVHFAAQDIVAAYKFNPSVLRVQKINICL